jgi:HAE1 family hydrophobic/amphiphilic exporter-1
MYAIARYATKHPVSVTVLAVAVVMLGWISWKGLPLDLLPDIQSPTILVSIQSGDRPPTEMERLYGEQVEGRLFTVRGIRSIDQTARTGTLIARVTFDWDVDMDLALVDVQKAVNPISADTDVDEVLVRRQDPRQMAVLTLGLVAPEGSPDLTELRRIAERQLAPALEQLSGVAEVRVTGGREEEVRVLLDKYLMEARGVTMAQLADRIGAANTDIDAGTLEEGNKVYMLRGLSRFETPEDVARVVVKYDRDAGDKQVPVRVSDLGRVVTADQEISHLVMVDGVEGVGLSVYKEADGNTVAVSRTVREALDQLGSDLSGVSIRVVSDDAALVEDAISDVEGAALIGILLAVLVLSLFLRSAGSTVVVAAAVPVSLMATLFAMHFAGQSLNLMTLGGLALGAGMLVDNAIVVMESIFRRRQEGDSPFDAPPRGTAMVAGAIAASTLTTCVVFLPVLFVQGLAARLVSGLSFTVVVSLAASLLVAVLLIPALAGWFLPRRKPAAIDPGTARMERLVLGLLRHPFLVTGIAVLLVAGAVHQLSGLGTELLAPADPREFSLRIIGPAGQRVESTRNMTATVEEILREAAGDDLRAILSEVGRIPDDDRIIREERTGENTARILVRLSAGGKTASQVVAAASKAVAALANMEVSWETGTSALASALGTTGPPIQVEISGNSLSDLGREADRIFERLNSLPELWNVRSSFEGGSPELHVVLNRTVCDALGVDIDTLSGVLETALDGRSVTTFFTGDEERDVVLRLADTRLDDLKSLTFTTEKGERFAVGDLARFEPVAGASEIFRRNQHRVARVTARIPSDVSSPRARAAVAAALADIDVSPGLTLQLSGEEEEREATFSQLEWAAMIALLLVFMVLAGTFESLVHPVTVLVAVPLALVGVAFALVPGGRPIGVMSVIGLIVLAGIAVNDAILLVQTARHLMEEGMERRLALARAASIRLRPILMTTLTTVLALLPLAVGTGDAAQLRSPLALTIIGGVIASTLFSLLVIPCLYLLLDHLRPGRRAS